MDNGSFLAINIHLWLTIKILAVMVFVDLNWPLIVCLSRRYNINKLFSCSWIISTDWSTYHVRPKTTLQTADFGVSSESAVIYEETRTTAEETTLSNIFSEQKRCRWGFRIYYCYNSAVGITRRASREVSGGVRNTLDGVVRAEPGDSRSETSPRGLHQ